jgi:hypothetical protein
MAKVKMVLSWCIPVVLVSAALLTPIIAQAGSVKIWPDQLKATDPGCAYYQDATSLAAESCDFTAPVNLPVGARITKITLYRILYPSATTSLSLERIKMGNLSNTLAEGEGSTNVEGEVEVVDVPFTVEPPSDPVVRAGYRYYIHVWTSGWAQFRGAKIDYRQ